MNLKKTRGLMPLGLRRGQQRKRRKKVEPVVEVREGETASQLCSGGRLGWKEQEEGKDDRWWKEKR
jgi:hypothetical protein